MRRWRMALATALALAPAGCVWPHGQRLDAFEAMRGPEGVWTTMYFPRGASLTAELLVLGEDRVFLRAASKVVVVPACAVRSIVAWPEATAEGGKFGEKTALPEPTLRLLSRFPSGFPPGVLDRLLRLGGQTEPMRLPELEDLPCAQSPASR